MSITTQEHFDRDQIDLIKNTICKGATDDEFMLFMHVCKKTKLDPFVKQIYPVKRWDSKLGKEVMTVQTGIDGYRLIAERTGAYSPGKEPSFVHDADGRIISSTAYVKKRTADGMWHEVAATAYYEEYVQKNKSQQPTSFWLKMPHNQLAKCAEALALRKAFPGDLSGIYTQEEMEQSSINDTEQEPVISKEDVKSLLEEMQTCDKDWAKKALDGVSKRFGSLAKMPAKHLEAFKEEMTKNRKVENE